MRVDSGGGLSGDLLAAIRAPKKLKKVSERKLPPPKEDSAAGAAGGKPGAAGGKPGGGLGAMGGMMNIAAIAAKRAQAMATKRAGK
jgi:hypothetical protein